MDRGNEGCASPSKGARVTQARKGELTPYRHLILLSRPLTLYRQGKNRETRLEKLRGVLPEHNHRCGLLNSWKPG